VDAFASWVAQARKGIVELFVLELLNRRGRMHGYGIVQALDETDGLVAASWETDTPGNPRKYYELTPGGALFLERAQGEWGRIGDAMDTLRGEKL
jgi:DNA-binding PadR family transcriptional regulator